LLGSTDDEEWFMAEETVFAIGVDAICTDGVCGEVIRVVVDPVARAVTHIVVEPKHRKGLGRLVPLDLVDATSSEVRLRCTMHAFEQLPYAEETQFLPCLSGYAGYGDGDVLLWPYYGLSAGDAPGPVTFDTVPLGEVAMRRGEQVHANDGAVGRVPDEGIRRGNQGFKGPRTDVAEIRMKLPRELVNALDIEVKHQRTNRAALTRQYIRDGLGLRLR
jgi:hypothetical protein